MIGSDAISIEGRRELQEQVSVMRKHATQFSSRPQRRTTDVVAVVSALEPALTMASAAAGPNRTRRTWPASPRRVHWGQTERTCSNEAFSPLMTRLVVYLGWVALGINLGLSSSTPCCLGLERWSPVLFDQPLEAGNEAPTPGPFRGAAASIEARGVSFDAESSGAITIQDLTPATGNTTLQEPQGVQDPVPPSGVASPATGPPRPTQDEIQTQRAAAAASDLDVETKKKIDDWYKAASERLTRLDGLAAKTTDLQQRIATADQRAEQLREAAKLSVEPARFNLDAASLADTQKEATDVEAQLQQWRERVAALDAQREAFAERRRQITTRLAAAPDQLTEWRMQLQAPPPEGEATLATTARRLALQMQLALAEAELPVLGLERDYIDGELSRDIIRLERDALAARIDLESRWLKEVNDAINLKREAEAKQAV